MFRIVQHPKRRPGKCALSGETTGPFIDTQKDVKRFGRIYLSIKFFDEPMRQLGYIGPDESEKLEGQVKSLSDEVTRLLRKSEDFDELIETLSGYLPTPEPTISERKVMVERAPSDEEIAAWIREKGKSHPLIRAAGQIEKGSTEEWNKLYRDKHDKPQKVVTTKEQQLASVGSEESVPVDEGPDKVVTLLDQDIDLDELLKNNVKDLNSYLEGKPEEFIAAFIRREYYIAENTGRDPRKGLLVAQEYWDTETDEPLYPADEDDIDEEDEEI